MFGHSKRTTKDGTDVPIESPFEYILADTFVSYLYTIYRFLVSHVPPLQQLTLQPQLLNEFSGWKRSLSL